MRPDMSTLRLMPWNAGTALVLCDLEWEDGTPVEQSPRQILSRQVARLAERARAAGFEVRDDQALPGHERAFIFDPFGNRLEFLRPTSLENK